MQISLSNISFLETQSILMFDAVKRHPAIGEYNCKFIAVMKTTSNWYATGTYFVWKAHSNVENYCV